MKIKLCACFLLLWMAMPPISAQNFNVSIDHIETKNGLIHRQVSAVFEDDLGLLWIGTLKGLQRYDGHEFKTWSKASPTGLFYNITSIVQDDEGWLWLWNNDKLKFVFLNPRTEQVLTEEERFPDFPITVTNDKSIIRSSSILKNSKGQLCFGTEKGEIITYCGATGFETLDIKNHEGYTHILYIDSKDNYWIGDNVGLENQDLNRPLMYKVNSKGKILKTFSLGIKHFVGAFCEFEDKICFLIMKYENGISNNKVAWIDQRDSLFLDEDLFGSPTRMFSVKSKLWFSYYNEKHEIYDALYKHVNFTIHNEDYDFPVANGGVSLIEDSRGIIWVFNEFGLFKVELSENKFRNYLHFEDGENPFNNSTRGIVVDNDHVFVNCEMTGTFKINKSAPKEYVKIAGDSWCRPMISTSNSKLIKGCQYGLDVIDKNGKFLKEYFYNHENSEQLKESWSFYLDKNEKLWIGGGINLYFKNKEESNIYKFHQENDPFSFSTRSSFIQNIIPYKDDMVWLCSRTGLYLFDTDKHELLARYASDEEKNFLPADNFYHIYEDTEGIFWIGTADGLIRWDGPKSKLKNSYRLFTRADGLSNEVIYALFEDDYNRLWLSSDYGLMSFDKESFDTQVYLEEDGISHHEFNRTSHYKDEEGRMYFGGLSGVTSFHPDDFRIDEEDHAQVIISDYEILDGQIGELINKIGELRESKAIYFRPGDRYFRLKFTIPTFKDPSKKLYGWKIEGVDENWNFQKENVIQIGVLPYGDHKLKIKGQSGRGGWSTKELLIDVHVLKPFYLQIWFIILCILVTILAIFAFFKIRTRVLRTEIDKATLKINEQAEELRKLDKLKSRFFANVSHELRTPLSMMLGPINNLIKGNGHNEKDKKLLSFLHRNTLHLKGLVNEILDLSKLESNKMELNEEPTELYGYLRNHLAQFYSFGTSERIDFITDIPENRELFILLDQNKFVKVINNYLSNAMKFTHVGGKVLLITEDLGSDILISVKDSGRGIHADDLDHVFDRFYQSKRVDAPTEGGTGIGLSLCKELVQLMKGEVGVESELGEGSSFFIKIPKKETEPFKEILKDPEIEVLTTQVEDEMSDAALDKHTIDHKTKESIHILIAEDNQDLREYYQMILTDYQVHTTEHGQAALDYLQSGNSMPDLIISDLMMPVMDGMQLIEQLKSSDEWRHIPVIMLTAKSDRNVRLKALRIGIDDYITKPFDDEELQVRIHNMLNRSNERKIESEVVLDEEEHQEIKHIKISQEEMLWLEKVEAFILKNMKNDLLAVDMLCKEFAMSKSTLLRQLKKITGLTPAKYIQEHRLNYARELLENRKYRTISQVADKIGFRDSSSFTRSFKQRFGVAPKSMLTSFN